MHRYCTNLWQVVFWCCKPRETAQSELLVLPKSFSPCWSGRLLISQATGEVMEATRPLEKSLWPSKTRCTSREHNQIQSGLRTTEGVWIQQAEACWSERCIQQEMGPVSCSCTWILITAAQRFSFHLSSQEERSAFSARVGQCFQRGRKGKTSPVSAAVGLGNAYKKISSEAAIYSGGGRIRLSFSCQTTHPHNYVFTPYFDNGSLQTN